MLSVWRSRSCLCSTQAAPRRVVTNGAKMADSWGELRTTHFRNCTSFYEHIEDKTDPTVPENAVQELDEWNERLPLSAPPGFHTVATKTRKRKFFKNRNADEFARIVPFALGVISDKERRFLVSGGSPESLKCEKSAPMYAKWRFRLQSVHFGCQKSKNVNVQREILGYLSDKRGKCSTRSARRPRCGEHGITRAYRDTANVFTHTQPGDIHRLIHPAHGDRAHVVCSGWV